MAFNLIGIMGRGLGTINSIKESINKNTEKNNMNKNNIINNRPRIDLESMKEKQKRLGSIPKDFNGVKGKSSSYYASFNSTEDALSALFNKNEQASSAAVASQIGEQEQLQKSKMLKANYTTSDYSNDNHFINRQGGN